MPTGNAGEPKRLKISRYLEASSAPSPLMPHRHALRQHLSLKWEELGECAGLQRSAKAPGQKPRVVAAEGEEVKFRVSLACNSARPYSIPCSEQRHRSALALHFDQRRRTLAYATVLGTASGH